MSPFPLSPAARPARQLLPAAGLLAALLACGGDGGADVPQSEGVAAPPAAASAPAVAPPPAAAAVEAELTAADLDAYARALAAELAVLESVLERRAAARTTADTAVAMLAATEDETAPVAASRAGIDADRYRRLERAFGAALAARAMNPAMREMLGDTSAIASLPPEAQAAARANVREMMAAFSDSATYRSVPVALHATLTQRAEAGLDSLFTRRVELRARAAGMAR